MNLADPFFQSPPLSRRAVFSSAPAPFTSPSHATLPVTLLRVAEGFFFPLPPSLHNLCDLLNVKLTLAER